MKEMVGGCCVCSDDRGWTENPLVYCDGQMCTVAVHQACYGIVTVPTGNWYCRKCESQERTARVRCELCPSKDGALKRTDTNGWAHVVCALYIPEVRFGNVTTMEPILLQQIPTERFNKVCYICEESGKGARSAVGACMQCNKSGCKQQFHVTCAQALGLLCEEAGNYLDNVKYCGYCQHHYSKLKKSGNVKTIPPYRPIPPENASDSSSPEKEPGDNWSKTTAKRKLSAGSKPVTQGSTGLKTPVSVSPSAADVSANQVDDAAAGLTGSGSGCVVQMKDSIPVLSQINVGKSDSSSGGKFTTSNFVEGIVTPSESVFGEVSKSSSKKRKKDDISVPVSGVVNPEDSAKKFKSENLTQQDGIQPASVVVKLPVGTNIGSSAGNSMSNSPVPAASVPSRIVSSSSMSPSATSSIVVSVPLATVSALPTTVAASTITATTTQSLTTMTVTTASTTANAPLAAANNIEESPSKRGRSQSTEKADKSGRNKKRGGGGGAGNLSTNVGSKRGGRSSQSTPPPPPPPPPPPTAVTVAVTSVTASVVTSTTAVTSASTVVSQPSAAPASVVAHSSAVVKVESPPSSPDGGKRSNHKSRKHQNLKEEKDVKDVKLFQNGINAPHMLGNQLNPASTMAQKMSDTLNQELEAHSIFTNDSSQSTNNLVGPQLHSRVIASVRSSNVGASTTSSTTTATATTTTTANSTVTTSSTSGVGWGGGQGTVPQTLDQLLERQWEQGSQFLMEQAQHFDIASLLSCLHQLRAENLRLEEHVNSLLQRRDHLLAVNARLAIPLTQVNNVHPAAAGIVPGVPQPGQVVPDGGRSSNQRVNNSYPTGPHPMENGLPPSPPTTVYRASPAQPSPSTISRHHSPGSAGPFVSSTPGVVVPRGSVTNEPHRSDSRRSNSQPSGPTPPQSASYPAMYQVPPQQQQMVMRREVVADMHNQIPPASKPS